MHRNLSVLAEKRELNPTDAGRSYLEGEHWVLWKQIMFFHNSINRLQFSEPKAFLKVFVIWSMIALPCCVTFCCTTMNQLYIHPLLLGASASHLHPEAAHSTDWAPSSAAHHCTQQLPTSYLLYVWSAVLPNLSCPLFPTLCPHVLTLKSACLYSCPINRFICTVFSRYCMISGSSDLPSSLNSDFCSKMMHKLKHILCVCICT